MNQVDTVHVGESLAHTFFCGNCVGYRTSKKSSRKRAVKRRKRKSLDQLKTLQVEFEKTTEWSKDLVCYLAHLTGLSEAQVYKWGWDQKKKMQCRERREEPVESSLAELFQDSHFLCISTRQNTVVEAPPACLSCVETIFPSELDFHLYQVQKSYK